MKRLISCRYSFYMRTGCQHYVKAEHMSTKQRGTRSFSPCDRNRYYFNFPLILERAKEILIL